MSQFAGMTLEKIEWLMEKKHELGGLHFVVAHSHDLFDVGHYEHCLVMAYVGDFGQPRNLPIDQIQAAFRGADKLKLKLLSDSFPTTWPLRLYRGVSGFDSERMTRGVSWTTRLDVACFFALKYNSPNPKIHVADVDEDEVFFHSNKREESEFVAIPASFIVLECSIDEMTIRSEREKSRIKESNAEYMRDLVRQGVVFETPRDCN